MSAMVGSANAPCVLILELGAGGHHPSYVRWLLESEFAKSSEIILAARREMFEHPEIRGSQTKFERYQIGVSQALEARLADFSSMGLLRMSWATGRLYRKICASLARTRRVDYVIVPFLDDCIVGIALPREAFGGIPWTAITMRTMFHYGAMGVIAPRQRFGRIRRSLLYKILKQKSLDSVLTIDPTLATFAKTQSDSFMRKVEYLPDPATYHPVLPTKTEARLQLGVPPDAALILLFGEISARKGAVLLLEAAADPSCSPRVHVMLAGRCRERAQIFENAAVHRLRADGRLHTIDGYVRGADEQRVLAAADCMWVGYTEFYGMSGVMVLSGRHGMPVLASREGLIGYLAKKHEVGLVIEPRNRSSVVNALNRLAEDPGFFRQAGKNGISVFGKHDPTELQRLVTERVTMKRPTKS
jgi:glycosyltransferase involved in cell wall biosynthesis